jgi:hypothetical protein
MECVLVSCGISHSPFGCKVLVLVLAQSMFSAGSMRRREFITLFGRARQIAAWVLAIPSVTYPIYSHPRGNAQSRLSYGAGADAHSEANAPVGTRTYRICTMNLLRSAAADLDQRCRKIDQAGRSKNGTPPRKT